jgi:hypothetical protein
VSRPPRDNYCCLSRWLLSPQPRTLPAGSCGPPARPPASAPSASQSAAQSRLASCAGHVGGSERARPGMTMAP